MPRPDTIAPTINENGEETHPAFAMIGASRISHSPPGAVLFDSDIKHQHYVTVRIKRAERKRDLSHDWIFGHREFVEVAMSEAQWASFVSSMNSGEGTPCTLTFLQDEGLVPGLPYEPRLAESMREVSEASHKAMEKLNEAFDAYEEKKNAANLRDLKVAIQNMPSNLSFVAKSLSEHAENVVQKARYDIEAMVITKAKHLGIEAGDLGIGPAQLTEGGE